MCIEFWQGDQLGQTSTLEVTRLDRFLQAHQSHFHFNIKVVVGAHSRLGTKEALHVTPDERIAGFPLGAHCPCCETLDIFFGSILHETWIATRARGDSSR